MTIYEFGDVVLVPFPFTDHSTAKKRRAGVVSSAAYRDRPDIILMAVTSQMRSPGYFGGVAVADWQQAGLIKPSLVKPIFTTIEKGLVLRKLGRLSEKDRTALKEAINADLGE